MRNGIINIVLLFVSLATISVFIEFVVFNVVLRPTNIPVLLETSDGEVIRYRPGQRGVWRIQDHVSADYRINREGWNSGRASYSKERVPGVKRIIVIGDSYVEALQVDYRESVAERLETKLTDTEVFRFGISGAPLSQYLYVLRWILPEYRPDVVIISVVHNDFLESLSGTVTSTFSDSFAKWRPQTSGGFEEIPPRAYQRDWTAWIKATNTYGYLIGRRQVDISRFKRVVLDARERRKSVEQEFEMNVSRRDLTAPIVPRLIDHFAQSLRAIQNENPSLLKVIVTMDGPRGRIRSSESCREPLLSQRLVRIHESMRDSLARNKVAFHDLSQKFFEAECSQGESLKVPNDGHWTAKAHEIVARELVTMINSGP